MSKKSNTFLFILGGTIFNILITLISFLVFLLIYSKFLYGRINEGSVAWVLPVLFVLAIVVSFFVYRLAVKIIMKKVDMEKHFDPIFRQKRGK
jgi:hypothetical protein